MLIEIKAPILPESVADATVITWHKAPGDFVKQDENLVDLETDKVVLEVPAPQNGILQEIIKPQGSVVTALEILASLEPSTQLETKAVKEIITKTNQPVIAVDPQALSPSTRRAAIEHDIDLHAIAGTGKDGRITKEDVLAAKEKTLANSSPVANKVISMVENVTGERIEQRAPMSRLRAKVAERLLAAQHNAAILTTFNEVNLQAVMDLRNRYKDIFEKKYNVRLGFMSFFTCAVVEALKRFPNVNASIDGNDVVYHGYFDIGIAVSTDRGLVVPVLRDADQLGFAQIEKSIAEFGKKARDGQLSIEEIKGGTFTITNGGVFGSLLSTPILNPPQSAILGMHKIEQRPVVEKEQIVIRPMMYLALSYDHRIIDGKESVSFLITVKELLEDPTRLLLEI